MKKHLFVLCLLASTALLHAQNFTGGYNFILPANDASASAFLPKFPSQPIVSPVVAVGKHFLVAGKPYRFWGVNVTVAAAFPALAIAPSVAARAQKLGINLVRFHHIDNPAWTGDDNSLMSLSRSTRILNPAALNRLDNFIAELKKKGIYTNMNLNVSRTFNRFDNVPDADSLREFGKGVTVFDPQLITFQKEYAKQILAHTNPYTGLKLAQDPALAMVEIINENSLYGMWKESVLKPVSQGGGLIVRHSRMLDSLWNGFLANRYGTQAALATAWQITSGNTANRIQDPGFENTTLSTNWQNEIHAGAMASFNRDATTSASGSNSFRVDVTTSSTDSWHVQFKHTNFSVKKDTSYIVKFWAKANAPRYIDVAFTRNDAPYTYYGSKGFSLTTAWQEYSMVVTAPEDNVGQVRLSYQLGNGGVGSVWFDDISFSQPTMKSFDVGEDLASKNIRRTDYPARVFFPQRRTTDIAEFYISLQKNFMENMRSYLRDSLGVTAPITGTNALVGIQEGFQHENLDFIDDHSYWDHPTFPGVAWDADNWKIGNQPMSKDANFGAITNAFSGIQMTDKPFTISEYNHAAPNIYRVEMLPAMVSYGSFHGMDGLMFFEYNNDSDGSLNNDRIGNFFSIHRDNAVMSLFPSSAFAYRYGLVAEAVPTTVSYTQNDIYTSHLIDYATSRWDKYVPYNRRLNLTHSIKTSTYSGTVPFSSAALPVTETDVYHTNTGQTVLNTKSGVLTTATPKYASISGFLKDNPNTQAGNLTLLNATQFGALTWLSDSEKGLSDADTTFITLASRTQNTGMTWNADNTSINTNWGNAPTAQQAISATLRVNINAYSLRLHTLSATGQSLKTTDICAVEPGVFEILLNEQTLWYALEVTNRTKCIPVELKRVKY